MEIIALLKDSLYLYLVHLATAATKKVLGFLRLFVAWVIFVQEVLQLAYENLRGAVRSLRRLDYCIPVEMV